MQAAAPMRLTDRERELAAIVSAYNEVTERLKNAHERLHDEVGRLRDELARKNAELRRRERLAALGEMAAGLAHEIRNPLGGIALYASMLTKELPQGKNGNGAAEKISAGVRSLERLVSEILDFAQERLPERRDWWFGEILPAVMDAVRPWAAQCHAAVTIDQGAESCRVHCDREQLHQVLVNLLMNGVQAAGVDGTVILRAESQIHNDGVQIEVLDDGPGILEADLHRIFNPFFTTKASGTGLGLAIVHRIVESHGGTVRAGNRPEGGAKFVLWLPS